MTTRRFSESWPFSPMRKLFLLGALSLSRTLGDQERAGATDGGNLPLSDDAGSRVFARPNPGRANVVCPTDNE